MRRAARHTRWVWGLGLGVWIGMSAGALAAESPRPLHVQIDRLIEQPLDGQVAAPATDAEFVRRAYLDLIGRPPETRETREFLDDPSPYKRARLVDQLLESREHARRMQEVFDVMWMERRPAKHVAALQKAVAKHDEEVPPAATAKAEEPAVVAEQECPCGSGKPFAKCHGAADEDSATA